MNTTAQELLNKAAHIMDERAKKYDKPEGERSMGQIVTAFNSITGNSLTEADGNTFMVILKLVRLFQNRNVTHQDSVDDCIAYAALLGETATNNGVKYAKTP